MRDLKNYECDGQIELTAYLESQIASRKVMDLTTWINSHGRSQYNQIGDVVKEVCKNEEVTNPQLINRITNKVSVYVLDQSMGYMNYLREQTKV